MASFRKSCIRRQLFDRSVNILNDVSFNFDNLQFMLPFLLVLGLSESYEVTVTPGEVKGYSGELNAGDKLRITSSSKYLAVLFANIEDMEVQIIVNEKEFKKIEANEGKIAGFDFGNNYGTVLITAPTGGPVLITMIAWPRECHKHRIISTLPHDTLIFSKNSTSPDHVILNDQSLCYWPAQWSGHYINVEMHTEFLFDILEFRSSAGTHAAFSGKETGRVYSEDGLEYFVWRSDGQQLSDNFTLHVTNVVEGRKPYFRKMLYGYGSNEVSPLFAWDGEMRDFYPEGIPNFPHEHLLLDLMPTFFITTIVFISGAILCVLWCVSVSMDNADIEEETGIAIEGEYVKTKDDMIPQPICMKETTEL